MTDPERAIRRRGKGRERERECGGFPRGRREERRQRTGKLTRSGGVDQACSPSQPTTTCNTHPSDSLLLRGSSRYQRSPCNPGKSAPLDDISCLWISSLGALRWPENPMAGGTMPKIVRFVSTEKQFGRISFLFFHTSFSLPQFFILQEISTVDDLIGISATRLTNMRSN